jgi:hypothetical protein
MADLKQQVGSLTGKVQQPIGPVSRGDDEQMAQAGERHAMMEVPMAHSSGGHAVQTEIGFDYDVRATRTAVVYLSRKCPSPVTKAKMCSLLFLADRNHLLRFGRPISGDDYEATVTGPVPVKTAQFLDEIDATADCDRDLLSESDFLTLDRIACEYGVKTEEQVTSAARATEAYHRAWRKAQDTDRQSFPMYFENFFADVPERHEVLEELLEDQRMQRVFPDLPNL